MRHHDIMSMTKAQDPSKLKMCGVNTGTELTILPAQPAQDKEAAFDLWRRANIDSTLGFS